MIEAAKLGVTVQSNALTVTGDIQRLGKTVAQAGTEGSQGIGKLESAFTGMQSSILPATAILVGAAATLKGVYDFGKMGAGILRMEESSGDLAASMGADMGEIVGAIRKASQGTVTDLDIMKSASRALMLGLSSDAGELGNLMEVAALKGRTMGISTSQAFSDIVTGVGKMSPEILDNLGIVLDATTTFGNYAEKIGKTADELSGAEKRQALLNRVLEEGNKQLELVGGLTNDAASNYERLEASWGNFTNNVKTWLAENTDLATALNVMVFGSVEKGRILDDLSNKLVDGTTAWEDYATQMIDANVRGKEMVGVFGSSLKGMMDETKFVRQLEERYGALDEAKVEVLLRSGQMDESTAAAVLGYQTTARALDEILEKYGIYTDAQYDGEKATREQTAAQVEQQAAIDGTKASLEGYQAKMVVVGEAMAGVQGDLVTATQKLEKAQKQWGEGAGGDVISQLEDQKVKGEEYAGALGAIDEVMGTNYILQLEYNTAVKDLVAEYKKTGDVENFKTKLGELKDTYMPLTESVREAKDEVWRLKNQIDRLESKMIEILVNISVVGEMPAGSGAGLPGGMQFGDENVPYTPPAKKAGQPAESTDDVSYGGIRATGGSYLATRPTYFMVGDAGPEQVNFWPQHSPSNDQGGGGSQPLTLRNFGTIVIQQPGELGSMLEALR